MSFPIWLGAASLQLRTETQAASSRMSRWRCPEERLQPRQFEAFQGPGHPVAPAALTEETGKQGEG